MAIETYKGIKVPNDVTDKINDITPSVVGGIIIYNDKVLADRVTEIESRNLTNWKFGSATPDATLNPQEGDAYFRSDGKVYVYSSNAWSQLTDLKGPAGATGQTGASGTNGTNGITPEISITPITGGRRLTVTVGSSSNYTDIIDGVDGQDGDSCSIAVTDITGGKHIVITNNGTQTASFDIYQGSNGTNGADGATIFTGTGVTGTGTSIEYTVSGSKAGDIYINTSTCNFYTASAANTWNYQMSLKGDPGQNGQNGQNGQDGADAGYDVVTITGTTPSISLAHGKLYDCTSTGITTLDITSSLSDVGKCACVTFQSPATQMAFTGPVGCYFKGDDTSAGNFSPAVSKYYSLDFRKLPNALTCIVVGY